MGVERVEAQPQGESEWAAESWETGAAEQPYFQSVDVEDVPRRSSWPKVLAALLILLALGWIGSLAFTLARSPLPAAPSAWFELAAMASAPLILIGLLWLIFGRSSRRETERFTTAVAQMRR